MIAVTSTFPRFAMKHIVVVALALRTRNRLMHDGLSFTKQEAIARHGVQATEVRQRYNALSAAQKVALLRFLDSLWPKRL